MSLLQKGLWTFLLIPTFLFGSNLFEEQIASCKRGDGCFVPEQTEDLTFLACVSFSMPERVWLEISKGLEAHGGAFVLRGMPNNSFQDFLIKILEWRKKGIHAPITVDPNVFEKYQIDAIPTFILEGEKGYRKVVGNVTIDYALRKLEGDN